MIAKLPAGCVTAGHGVRNLAWLITVLQQEVPSAGNPLSCVFWEPLGGSVSQLACRLVRGFSPTPLTMERMCLLTPRPPVPQRRRSAPSRVSSRQWPRQAWHSCPCPGARRRWRRVESLARVINADVLAGPRERRHQHLGLPERCGPNSDPLNIEALNALNIDVGNNQPPADRHRD